MDKRILDGNALIAQSMGAVFHPEIKLYNNPESMWIFISRPAPSVPLQLGPSQLEYQLQLIRGNLESLKNSKDV